MKPTASDIDLARRWLLAASTGGAAASLAGFSTSGLAQAKAKALPPVAAFKDAARMIVHSANGVETRRDAFGSSDIIDLDVLFLRNNANPPSESVTANPDAWQVTIDGVVSPRTLTVGELKNLGLGNVAMVLQCSGNGRAFFNHNPSGSRWSVGAVLRARDGAVRLATVRVADGAAARLVPVHESGDRRGRHGSARVTHRE